MKLTKFCFTLWAICSVILMMTACEKAPQKEATDTLQPDTTQSVAAQTDTTNPGSLAFTEYDTPPSPVENPMPAYPPKYRSSGIQGVVLLDVQVLATGSVGEITVKKSLMDGEGGLDEAALTSVKNWIFKPAMKDNKAVSSHVNVPVPFTLK